LRSSCVAGYDGVETHTRQLEAVYVDLFHGPDDVEDNLDVHLMQVQPAELFVVWGDGWTSFDRPFSNKIFPFLILKELSKSEVTGFIGIDAC
jgi:hypothetical protein